MVDGFRSVPTLIELGSGSSTKTRRLIGATLDRYESAHYVPIDVSPTILEESARALLDEFPGLQLTGYAADYRIALDRLPNQPREPRVFLFLGSSIGNYTPAGARDLLSHVARAMRREDRFLLGTDLAKSPSVLEPAYDDSAGVSAQFNLNLLGRINRELGGEFDLSTFSHRARYRDDPPRVEMHLVSLRKQRIAIPGAGLVAHFREGEAVHTEDAHKYTPALLEELAREAGFAEDARWTDPAGLFQVQRWRPIG
jgi:dimethylhistidine N-methyltransferase